MAERSRSIAKGNGAEPCSPHDFPSRSTRPQSSGTRRRSFGPNKASTLAEPVSTLYGKHAPTQEPCDESNTIASRHPRIGNQFLDGRGFVDRCDEFVGAR